MKPYLLYPAIAVASFTIGVNFVLFGHFQRRAEEPTTTPKAFATEEFHRARAARQRPPKLAEKPPSYELFDQTDIVPKLNALVKYKQKSEKQTFYVFKNQETAFAYWQADNSIYILNVIENENIDWFDGKARIDLQTEVVPTGKFGSLGCCLYERDWVKSIIKKCRKGQKIIINP